MNRLTLIIDNGRTVEFADKPVNDKDCLDFRLWALLPDPGFFVVMQSGYEWCNYLLINSKDGRQQEINQFARRLTAHCTKQ